MNSIDNIHVIIFFYMSPFKSLDELTDLATDKIILESPVFLELFFLPVFTFYYYLLKEQGDYPPL